MQFDINQIDRQQLKKLNLIDSKGQILLNRENIEFLKQGKQTDDIDLKNIAFRDKPVNLRASLSLYQDKDSVKVRVHPYYMELERNQLLSDTERKYISEKAGVHSKHTHVSGEIIEHGEAKYKFDEKQQNSYYVKLKTANGEDATVWGVNLQKGLEGKTAGEKVTIKYTGQEAVTIKVPTMENGREVLKPLTTYRNDFSVKPYNEKNDYRNSRILIEFNKEKNSFDIVNTNRVPKVQSINGDKLTKAQQESLERGEEITTSDGSKVKYSPQKQTFVQANNKRLLIASLILDGGLSYLLIKAVDHFSRKQETKTGVDKEYIKELEKLKNEIDNKIRKTDDKKELTEIKDYINKEIDKVSVTPYQERDLEQRREDTLSNQVDDKENTKQEKVNIIEKDFDLLSSITLTEGRALEQLFSKMDGNEDKVFEVLKRNDLINDNFNKHYTLTTQVNSSTPNTFFDTQDDLKKATVELDTLDAEFKASIKDKASELELELGNNITLSPEERQEALNEMQQEKRDEEYLRSMEESPFDETLEIGKDTDEIKHNDLLEDWERDEIERQEVEFNEQEQSEESESESESQDISDDDAGGDEEEDEEQERSRGRSR